MLDFFLLALAVLLMGGALGRTAHACHCQPSPPTERPYVPSPEVLEAQARLDARCLEITQRITALSHYPPHWSWEPGYVPPSPPDLARAEWLERESRREMT